MKKILIVSALSLACVFASTPIYAAEKEVKTDKKQTCCETSKAAGKQCTHKCCVSAERSGKVCEKCNPGKAQAQKK